MIPQRPGAVLAIGIINLVLGIIGTLFAFCTALGAILQPTVLRAVAQMNPNMPPMPEPPAILGVVNFVIGAVGFGLSVAGIVCAIGLIRMRPWARQLCLILAGVWILSLVLYLFTGLVLVKPHNDRYLAQMEQWQEEVLAKVSKGAAPAPRPDLKTSETIGLIINVVISLVFVGYNLVQILVMMLPDVRQAFDRATRPYQLE